MPPSEALHALKPSHPKHKLPRTRHPESYFSMWHQRCYFLHARASCLAVVQHTHPCSASSNSTHLPLHLQCFMKDLLTAELCSLCFTAEKPHTHDEHTIEGAKIRRHKSVVKTGSERSHTSPERHDKRHLEPSVILFHCTPCILWSVKTRLQQFLEPDITCTPDIKHSTQLQ